MNTALTAFIETCTTQFSTIPVERKLSLIAIASAVREKLKTKTAIHVVYVCTHNSRRSHFGQIWGKTAAAYYGIPEVQTFSAGTEATAFNPNAIKAIQSLGFSVHSDQASANPVYEVSFDSVQEPIRCFSKTYQHDSIPKNNLIAIMTCTEADGNCPYIPGTDLRIALPYADPKAFDGTTDQDRMYLERCQQIAVENLFLFSSI